MSTQHSGKFATAALGLLLAGAPAVQADPLAAEFDAIRTHLAAEDGAEAVAAARRLYRATAEAAGFGLSNPWLTAEPAEGYGVYTPRADNVFAVGEPIHAYVEPFGQSLVELNDGRLAMRYEIRFAVLAPDGTPMTDLIEMERIELPARQIPVDAYLRLTFRVSAPPGDYIIHAEIDDVPTGQTMPVRWEVRFR